MDKRLKRTLLLGWGLVGAALLGSAGYAAATWGEESILWSGEPWNLTWPALSVAYCLGGTLSLLEMPRCPAREKGLRWSWVGGLLFAALPLYGQLALAYLGRLAASSLVADALAGGTGGASFYPFLVLAGMTTWTAALVTWVLRGYGLAVVVAPLILLLGRRAEFPGQFEKYPGWWWWVAPLIWLSSPVVMWFLLGR